MFQWKYVECIECYCYDNISEIRWNLFFIFRTLCVLCNGQTSNKWKTFFKSETQFWTGEMNIRMSTGYNIPKKLHQTINKWKAGFNKWNPILNRWNNRLNDYWLKSLKNLHKTFNKWKTVFNKWNSVLNSWNDRLNKYWLKSLKNLHQTFNKWNVLFNKWNEFSTSEMTISTSDG